jgi:hypothetical protein
MDRPRRIPLTVWSAAALTAIAVSGCANDARFEHLMGLGVCDPDRAGFSIEIDNPFLPLPVGHVLVLEDPGSDLLVRITVLDEVETVAGVQTRVVEEHEEAGGRVVEISRNFFAQAGDGTVCYFGEEVDIYDEEGNVSSHSGAWRADGDRLLPGIFMPAAPKVGQAFQQEVATGIAEDQSAVVALGETVEVPGGTFTDTATLLDRNPLDGSEDTKFYARGVGLIVDESAQLTSSTDG